MNKHFSGMARQIKTALATGLLLCLGSSLLPLTAEAESYKPRRSDIIKAFMYNEQDQTLLIYFLNGKVYEYQSIPEDRYKGLKDAPLKGGYYITWIQDKFKFIELHTSKDDTGA